MVAKINRREFLRGAAMTAVGMLAASCAQPTPIVVEKEVPVEKVVKETVVVEKEVAVEKVVKETVVQEKEVSIEKVVTATPVPSKYNEAPELAAMVAEGRLPPVEDRLPLEPLVLTPYIEVGKYGGVWRQMHLGSIDRWQNSYKTSERLGKFEPDGSIVPNVARAWSFNSDATELTFQLRKGMKWDDGKPFSADDVLFWWNDVALNTELSPTLPSAYRIGGEPAHFEKVDDYAFKIIFPAPYGGFEDLLPVEEPWRPAHYLKKFHKAYASAAELDAAMKEVGVETWTDLFGAKTSFANNPGTPGIMPWNPTGFVDEPIQVWERNAYYYKVDTAGNQLPYINAINRILLPDAEAILLKAIAGEADFESRRIEGVANYPTVMANREKGNYSVVFEDTAGSNVGGTIFFNWYTENEELAELFWEKDFRIALSVAIDRQEIGDIVYKGLCPPSAVSVSIGSPWYEPQWGPEHPWIQYDPDMANELLDGLGLTNRDSEGYRLLPSGNRLSMIMLNFADNPSYSPSVEIHEFTKEYWKAVGVELINTPTARQLWEERMDAGDYELGCYICNFGHKTQTPLQQRQIAPVGRNQWWGRRWGFWYETDGQEGEEPPEAAKELQRLFELALADPDVNKRIEYIKQMCAIHAEEFYMIGMFNEPDEGRWMVVNNKLGNVLPKIPGSNALAFNTPLLFFKE